jgi:DNA-binding response OmpR family regulator
MTCILVVDDEPDLVWAVEYSLRDEGYEVCTACDGVQALDTAHNRRPDLIILDIVMPRLDGLQVCQTLRRDPALAAVPILFLTVRNTVEDLTTGLGEGGDDYLVKPFDLRELKARVKALLRRTRPEVEDRLGTAAQETLLVLEPITLDLRLRQVHVNGRCAQLSPAELNLLRYLMTHAGQIFSSQELLQRVWNYTPGTADPGLVRQHIKNLRAKIEPDLVAPRYIRTIPHHGYILDLPSSDDKRD